MRIIGEIPHPEIKITLFSWNNRYLIKLERDLLEQTYKINQFDLAEESDLQKVVSPTFIQEALDCFESMESSIRKAKDIL